MINQQAIWTLASSAKGMQTQVRGLAEAVNQFADMTIVNGLIMQKQIGKVLPPAWSAAIGWYNHQIDTTIPPSIIIGCGAGAQASLLALKKRYHAFVVYIQRPQANALSFDAIVAPKHDYYNKAVTDNVIQTVGAVGQVTPDVLATRRQQANQRFNHACQVGVLIGGDNRAYQLDIDLLIKQLTHIVMLTQSTLLITPSRRTKPSVTAALKKAFTAPHFVWEGNGDNPYFDILAAADGFCVTADSVNMISEASASDKGIYVLPMKDKTGRTAQHAAKKFSYFHQLVIHRGNIRLYNNHWEFFQTTPLDERQHTAEQLWYRYQQTHIKKT